MSLNEEERKRLYSFKKNTQVIQRVGSLDIEKEKKYLETDLKYWKKKLKYFVNEENSSEIDKSIEILTELLAKRYALSLQEKEKLLGKLSEHTIKNEFKNYVDECYKLLAISHKIKQIYG